jgi:hypothetical protein
MNTSSRGETPTRVIDGGNRSFLGCVFIAAAAICFFGAAALAVNTWRFTQTALRAPGKVIQLIEQNVDGDTTFRAVFRFQDVVGKEHTVVSSNNSKPATHSVGDVIVVLYEREHPGRARINSFWELWFIPMVAGTIAVGFCVISFFIIRKSQTKSPVA